MSTALQPQAKGAFDDLPNAAPGGSAVPQQSGGAFDDLPDADPNADKGLLGQLASREWAGAHSLVHGVLSIPAGVVGLPALASKAISHLPAAANDPVMQSAGRVLGAVGDAVEPVQAGLQGVADAISPKASATDLGFTGAHWWDSPKIGNAISTGLDVVGGIGGGNAVGGLLGRVSKLVGGAAPDTRVGAAMTTGINELPVGTKAITPTTMPADLAPDLASWARRQSPEAARIIEGGLKARSTQQYPQIAQALQDATGQNVGTLATDISDQIAQAKAAAAPHYQAAYAAPEITDPGFVQQFQALASTPGGKQAYATAERIAQAEGTPIPSYGKIISKGPDIPDWVRKSTNPNTLPNYMQQMTAEGGDATGSIGVRTLDLFKRGLDDVIQQRGDATATLGRQEGRALQSRLTPLLQSADQLVPDYGTARATASTGFGLDDAASQARHDFGSAGAATPEEVSQRLMGLSDPERRIYTQAGLQQVLDNLKAVQGSATGRADLATKLWSSIGGRGKLTALVGDSDKADALGDAMENLAAQQETLRSVTGGSQSAEKFATDARMGGRLKTFATAASALHGNPGAMLKLLGQAAEKAATMQSAQAAERMAPLLVKQGPDALRALQTAATQTAGNASSASRLPALLGAGAGAIGTQNP